MNLVRSSLVLSLLWSTATAINTTLGRVDGVSSPSNIFVWWRKRRGHFLNFHKTLSVGGSVERIFKPTNGILLSPGELIQNQEFLSGLQAVRDAIATAETDGKRLRAYDSKYTSNKMLYNKEYLLESWGLNYYKIGIEADDQVTTKYQLIKDRLVFVQAGVRLKPFNLKLFESGYALSTSGATDGARFVGAVSTATHGSANQVGGIQATVRAIHVVVVGEHYLLQRSSDPVVTEDYAAMMGNVQCCIGEFWVLWYHSRHVDGSRTLVRVGHANKEDGLQGCQGCHDNVGCSQQGGISRCRRGRIALSF
jgi:hypothetical protein